jgi:hypothetical protein
MPNHIVQLMKRAIPCCVENPLFTMHGYEKEVKITTYPLILQCHDGLLPVHRIQPYSITIQKHACSGCFGAPKKMVRRHWMSLMV